MMMHCFVRSMVCSQHGLFAAWFVPVNLCLLWSKECVQTTNVLTQHLCVRVVLARTLHGDTIESSVWLARLNFFPSLCSLSVQM